MKKELILISFFLTAAFIHHITISKGFITLDQLTLNQKIGQLFMVAAVADEEIAQECICSKTYRVDQKYITQLIEHYYIGGIIYLGKSNPEKQIKRTQYFQSISTIPLLVGQDLEPGRVGKSRFPHDWNFVSNQELGTINNEEQTYKIGLKIGHFCRKLGVHINFAPVADVNNNPHNSVINDRSFGDNPETVAQHAIAFANGLRDAGIIACAKHFPGHGDTSTDSHVALPIITHNKERLHAVELYPFKALISVNIPAIMIGHLEVPAFEPTKNLPSTLSKNIVTELLQTELGFTGLIITDALDMRGVTDLYCKENLQSYPLRNSYDKIELDALLAGNDILLCPVNVPAAIAAIKQAVNDTIITEQEIDAHVAKVLHIKNLLFNPQ